ncbi:MAG: DUF58 domain-containing protein [Flavobacteriaceae bacterium]|jgi:uncharacterized protein (DUF58 family)|nr:DUF58 domain-containing protein [Flavobacteriaceae bacterium]MDG1912318.1 DUF58 domain-containing protein [Flavobacteriaceae bacterium]
MDTKALLKKVRKIEIKTRRLSDHVFGGEYHSTFKGRGMTFSEVRQYQFGDDVRAIDWNVTARYNEPFVKVFEEERELTLMLVVDVSGSEAFGTKTQFKREILTEIAATLAFSALQNNDKVGLLLFSEQVELFIPPKKGRSHILRIIRELLEFEPKSKETNISAAFEFLSGVLKKKAIVFMLSDFMDSDYEKTLRITAKKHDLTGIRVYDPVETKLPKLGIVPMRDAETGQIRWINTQSKKVRDHYAKYHNERTAEYQELFKKNGAGNLSCSVEESYVKKLLGYFKARI